MRLFTLAALAMGLAACSTTSTPPEMMGGAQKPPKAKIQVAYLGVGTSAMKDGLKVASVHKDSPAALAGLQAKDVVISVNNIKVTKTDELKSAVKTIGAGKEAIFHVKRGENVIDIKCILGTHLQDQDDDKEKKAGKKKKEVDDDDIEDEHEDEDDDDGDEDDD